ncbi:LEAF RUST 10 DISEASE-RESISTANCEUS RECEPTOR-LIKE PROTEIN KINASE-like 1.2 isoform X2 [Euphorbia lathyris]|uniref:LEAF RUST 10 DISEASE-RESISTANCEUS RECEPTOR-LIKE PROTEIN KINASE-like 1.2 isoform X2 n=1 Tax=Euphorbia lathyris TaxID=212925 RepID=UPI0033131EA1
MDLKNLSISYNPVFVYLTFLFFTILTNQSLSLNEKFTACAPKSCGKGPNISYPFRLSDVQQSYCGYPNFDLTCNHDDYPVLTLPYDEYVIENIFYPNQSFHIASASLYEEDTCPVPLHNMTLDRTPFTINPGYFNFSFFYNCTRKPTGYPDYPISCYSNSSQYSFALFHTDLLESPDNSSLDSCHYFVYAPLHIDDNFDGKLSTMNYTDILKSGILLNWTAPNCSTCERSGGRCGFENNEFVCFCTDKSYSNSCSAGSDPNIKLKVGIGLGASFGSVAIMCILFFIYIRRKKKDPYAPSSFVSQTNTSDFSSKYDMERGGSVYGVQLFTYEQLEEATNNFDSKKELGEGGFGTVYHGKLQDGRSVAVKRLYENNYKRAEQFMNEVDLLTHLRHPHLVSLYGCTSRHSRELLLVYEYISNGTVADHVHGERAKPGALPWHTRMNIAVETASALAYLHRSDIIHRDVKTNNILLDDNFCVKVADFGLSRLFPLHVTHVSTAPQGTPGYVDPEYHECYQLTSKSDVYSFGVVLIELISSMPAVDITRHRHEINLSTMAVNKIQSNALDELVDHSLGFDSDYAVRKMINAVAELAFQCLQSGKELRPTMDEVLETLMLIKNKDYDLEKKEEMDTLSDDVGLLKSDPPLHSPDSVMIKWKSTATTPNASG